MSHGRENGDREGFIEPEDGKSDDVDGDDFGDYQRSPDGEEDEEPAEGAGENFQ